MIQIADLPRDRVDEVLHLALGPGQADFVGTIGDMVKDPLPARDFHVVWDADQVVGFFKIDRDYAPTHAFAEVHGWGLRGLLIGAQYQGRGLGRALLAALPAYLSARYPRQRLYYLTVNCRNARAYDAYLASGWTDAGGLYLKGRSGPQNILRLDLS
ncbi:GNAT family N-acetyltransferase [Nioella ostreopsis]|uniref:GNAT family N-acetyltransferase n=1 Tax=Nioella ostreopsis TaxID=2448479 RepID=UPI000FD9D293|nr:GNAT family N-acetyltransferase [Nioella ostreopsis]